MTIILRKTKFYAILFFFILAANIAHAQKQNRIFVGAGAGPDFSFNKLKSDKPLPNKIDKLQRAGISFDFFLEYIITKHLSLQADIKTAKRKTGIRYDDLINERDAQGHERGSHSGASFIGNAPVHFNLGAKLNSNLLRDHFIVAAGVGLAYIVIDKSSASAIGTGGGLGDEENLYAILIETRESNYGLLLNTNASLSYRVGTDKFLQLTVAYNQGLVTIYKQQSKRFDYQTAQGTESYAVSIFNKGSYAALQVGYKLPLHNLPLLKNKKKR